MYVVWQARLRLRSYIHWDDDRINHRFYSSMLPKAREALTLWLSFFLSLDLPSLILSFRLFPSGWSICNSERISFSGVQPIFSAALVECCPVELFIRNGLLHLFLHYLLHISIIGIENKSNTDKRGCLCQSVYSTATQFPFWSRKTLQNQETEKDSITDSRCCAHT